MKVDLISSIKNRAFMPYKKPDIQRHQVHFGAQDVFIRQKSEIQKQQEIELLNSYDIAIKALMTALNDKNPYTYNHCLRVGLYTAILARELGVSEDKVENIEKVGLLHDIGKLTIPNEILYKEGKLTPEEFEIIKTHPNSSVTLIHGLKDSEQIALGIKYHHERWDGRGYPIGLDGKNIPYSARIVSVADTYDAMTSMRPYRDALSHKTAIEEIEKCAGKQFDPSIAGKFLDIENIISEARINPKEHFEQYSTISERIR